MSCETRSESQGEPRELQIGVPLPNETAARLQAAGWEDRVGARLGIWVSVLRQRLTGIENNRVVFSFLCSTAARGTGSRQGSYQTPLGWHAVEERFGAGLPLGAVFKERKYTGRDWSPGDVTGEDLILTRILWLRGLEKGVNAGKGIDSHARYIYIHGTPEEDKLGTPASMGCIRLSNKDVIEAFNQTATGTPVLITSW